MEGQHVTIDTSAWAKAYVAKYRLAVVHIEPGKKYPTHDGWNAPGGWFNEAIRAALHYRRNPTHGIGVVLGPSRLCSLDVDDVESTRIVLEEFGIDLDQLRASYPTIVGNPARFRIEFSLPAGIELSRHALTWPRQDNPAKRFTVLELRAGDVQDVFPPTIHPDTGQPYFWATKPNGHFPELPAELLRIWQHWDVFKKNAEALCPWAQPPKPAPAAPAPARDGGSVIEAFVAAHDLGTMLDRYGYKRQGKRWLSPHSGTGLAGVIPLDASRVYIHHASDPLCSDHPVNAFDLFAHYDHGGNVREAVKAAAEMLGLKHERRPRPAPSDIGIPITVENQQVPIPSKSTELEPARRAVDYYAGLPNTTDKGKPQATIENLAEIARRLGLVIRYNVIKKEEELLIPGQGFTLDNRMNASLGWLMSECAKFGYPIGSLDSFVTYLADANQFNPVAQWITSRPWDGQDRLTALYATVRAKNEATEPRIRQMKECFMRRWMLSAVAGAFRPTGVSAHGILTFQGDQYAGKTKWFKSLVPADLGVLQDGVRLNPDDRDSVKQCVSNWLVELGELDATFRRSDIAALKAFITRDRDVLRRAYARKESEFARRTVFFASVNPENFLHDPTGNRRYWTVAIDSLDLDHKIDMQQCWAQVHQLYEAGESWFLSVDELNLLNDHNRGFEVLDPTEERISGRLNWDAADAFWSWRSVTSVLASCGLDKPSQSETTKAGQVIRRLNGNRAKRTEKERLVWVPPTKGSTYED